MSNVKRSIIIDYLNIILIFNYSFKNLINLRSRISACGLSIAELTLHIASSLYNFFKMFRI